MEPNYGIMKLDGSQKLQNGKSSLSNSRRKWVVIIIGTSLLRFIVGLRLKT